MASQITDKDLDEIYSFAVQLGKDAGKILMDRAQLRMTGPVQKEEQKFVEKENAVDIVTQTDTGMSNFSSWSLEYPCVLPHQTADSTLWHQTLRHSYMRRLQKNILTISKSCSPKATNSYCMLTFHQVHRRRNLLCWLFKRLSHHGRRPNMVCRPS